MNRPLLRALLALYPRPWRDRYGAELASLTEDLISAGEITQLSAVLNLAGGAALEWGRVLAGSRRAAAATALAAIMAVAGIFYLTSPARPPSGPASVRSAPQPEVAPMSAVVVGRVRPGPYPGCTPSPVAVHTTSVPEEEEEYGPSTPSPTVAMSPANSCGPSPSPVTTSTATPAQEEHGLSPAPSPSASPHS
jgi:hypothetical protein